MRGAERGLFVTLEGIDGTGKSTQSMALARALREMGREVLLTREPGGSTGAEEIRRLLLEGPPDRWSAETEILLFTAARRDHMEKTIQPALEAGRIVVCDRFADSTRVYQGITRGDLRGKVDALHDLMIGRDPDLTFVLDMPPDKGLARARARNNGEERFEDFGLGMQERMRTGFLELAQTLPHRCRVIDANRAPDIIAADIFRLVRRALP